MKNPIHEDADKDNRRVAKTFIFLGIMFWGVGVLFLVAAGFQVYKDASPLGWPTAQGVVTVSSFEKDRYSDAGDCKVDFEYDFEYVDGVKWTGKELYFSSSRYGINCYKAKIWVEKYPVGKEVTVYMKPEGKRAAYIEPGVHFTEAFLGVIALTIVGFLFFVIGKVKQYD